MANTNSVPMGVFGPGAAFVTRTDIAGSAFNVGYVNEFSYDEAAENKELFGQNQYPLLVARGTIKATGKWKAATISGLALNQCWYGQTITTGQILTSLSETQTVSSATTGITADTIQPTNQTTAASMFTDLGVSYTTSVPAGLPLVRVTSGTESVGHYSVGSTSSGVYNFASGDLGATLKLNYAYQSLTAGQTITVVNEPIGTTPTFQLDFVSTLYGATYYLRFFSCIASKLTRAHKLTDFMMPEVDFAFFANSAGNVYEMTQTTSA